MRVGTKLSLSVTAGSALWPDRAARGPLRPGSRRPGERSHQVTVRGFDDSQQNFVPSQLNLIWRLFQWQLEACRPSQRETPGRLTVPAGNA